MEQDESFSGGMSERLIILTLLPCQLGGEITAVRRREKQMRKADEERVARYRKAYPLDQHTDSEILNELNEGRKEKKDLDGWIERQAGINLNYCFNNHK